MNYLKNIQRGIDYIELHLDMDIETADVAKVAGISHWHFQRIFRALTNETLKSYIRSRRFSQSLDQLASTDSRILDIALRAGFESQESFTRAFKKAFFVTPAEYRKSHQALPFLKKIKIDEAYLRHIHADISREPEIYLQEKMSLIGLKTSFYGVDSEKNNMASKLPGLWGALMPELGALQPLNQLAYGVICQSPDQGEELDYYAAVQTERSCSLEMSTVEIPEARYAKFIHRGEVSQLDLTVNYIYSSWLLQSGFRHSYGPDLEIYGSEFIPNSADSVMYYAIPIV